MIAAATGHATTSYNVLTWLSIGVAVVGLLTSALSAYTFRILKRITHESPQITLPELFKHRIMHDSTPVAQYDQRDPS